MSARSLSQQRVQVAPALAWMKRVIEHKSWNLASSNCHTLMQTGMKRVIQLKSSNLDPSARRHALAASLDEGMKRETACVWQSSEGARFHDLCSMTLFIQACESVWLLEDARFDDLCSMTRFIPTSPGPRRDLDTLRERAR